MSAKGRGDRELVLRIFPTQVCSNAWKKNVQLGQRRNNHCLTSNIGPFVSESKCHVNALELLFSASLKDIKLYEVITKNMYYWVCNRHGCKKEKDGIELNRSNISVSH